MATSGRVAPCVAENWHRSPLRPGLGRPVACQGRCLSLVAVRWPSDGCSRGSGEQNDPRGETLETLDTFCLPRPRHSLRPWRLESFQRSRARRRTRRRRRRPPRRRQLGFPQRLLFLFPSLPASHAPDTQRRLGTEEGPASLWPLCAGDVA
jgi:hypothetical protein